MHFQVSGMLFVGFMGLLWFATAKTLYVGPNGSDKLSCSGGGSYNSPFFSLTQALNCADDSGDSILMRGGDYEYRSIVFVSKSVTISNAEGESPRILLVDVRNPFFAIQGDITLTFENIAVSGFNVIDQNIPSAGFILNVPGSKLARNIVLNNVDFQNFEAYDDYNDWPTHVVDGMYQSLTVSNCQFNTKYSYWSPNTHIKAGVTNSMTIINNTFNQPTIKGFIYDSAESSSAGSKIVISGNKFPIVGNIAVIQTTLAEWHISDSKITNITNAGIVCSLTKKSPVSGSTKTTVYIEDVMYESSTKPMIVLNNGCAVEIKSSSFQNTKSGATISCTDSKLMISDSSFVNDQYATSCFDCLFSSVNNNVTGGNAGSCAM